MLAEIFLPPADRTSGSAASAHLPPNAHDEDGTVSDWLAYSGDFVHQGQLLGHAEVDGTVVEIAAPATGVLHLLVPIERTLPATGLLGVVDTAPDARSFTVTFAPAQQTAEPEPAVPAPLTWKVDRTAPTPWATGSTMASQPLAGLSADTATTAAAPVSVFPSRLESTPTRAVRLPLLSRRAIQPAPPPEAEATAPSPVVPLPQPASVQAPSLGQVTGTLEAAAADQEPAPTAIASRTERTVAASTPSPIAIQDTGATKPMNTSATPAPRLASLPSVPVMPAPRVRLYASPSARALARQTGVDVISIKGSGPFGRVEAEDVRASFDPWTTAGIPTTAALIDAIASQNALPQQPPAERPLSSDLFRLMPAPWVESAPKPSGPGQAPSPAAPDVQPPPVTSNPALKHLPEIPIPEALGAALAGITRTALEPDTAASTATAPTAEAEVAPVCESEPLAPLSFAPAPRPELQAGPVAAALAVQVDATNLALLRDRLTAGIQKRTGEPLSYGVILAKLAALTLHDHPTLNARQTDQGFERVPSIEVGIEGGSRAAIQENLTGYAQAGNTVTVLTNPAGKDLLTLSREAAPSTQQAMDMAEGPASARRASLTIIDLSDRSVDTCTPALTYPQCATLAFGSIAQRPVVRDGQVIARATVFLSLAYHATAVTASQAASFLAELASLVEDPSSLAEGLIF